jgi:hypothetical protein
MFISILLDWKVDIVYGERGCGHYFYNCCKEKYLLLVLPAATQHQRKHVRDL